MFAALLAPLRLPERALAALESLGEAGRHLGPMHSELTGVREQTEPLGDLMPLMERLVGRLEESLGTRLDALQEVVVALEGNDSHLNRAVGELQREVAGMHKTLAELQDDVQRITDRLPVSRRGPLEKARAVLDGTGDREKS